VVERWNDEFGSRYRQLRLGYKYLRDVLRYQFPNLPERAREAERARREAERVAQEEQGARYRRLEGEWSGIKGEVGALMRQLEECLDLLIGSGRQESRKGNTMAVEGTGFDGGGLADDFAGGWEEPNRGPLVESADNAALFESVRELYQALQQHLKASQGWLTTLMRGEPSGGGGNDPLLRDVVALRNGMLALKGRWEELGVDLRRRRVSAQEGGAEEIEDEEMWEEGELPAGGGTAAEEGGVDGGQDEERKEREALGLVSEAEAVAERGGISDAVQDLIGALPTESIEGGPEGREGERRGVPQSNLVLKPGGRGLARSENLKVQRNESTARLDVPGGKGRSLVKEGASSESRGEAPLGRAEQPGPPAGPAAWAETEAIEGPQREDEAGTAQMGAAKNEGKAGDEAIQVEASRKNETCSPDKPFKRTPSTQSAPSAARALARDPTLPRNTFSLVASTSGANQETSKPSPSGRLSSSTTNLPAPRTGGVGPGLAELRANAPVIPWGPYLDHWGAEGSVPVDMRGLVIENHWGPVDREATLPAERLREMHMHASYYQPEKKEIKVSRNRCIRVCYCG
jgi:hypothetical protein